MENTGHSVTTKGLDDVVKLDERREVDGLHVVRVLRVVRAYLRDVIFKVLLIISYFLYLLIEPVSFMILDFLESRS